MNRWTKGAVHTLSPALRGPRPLAATQMGLPNSPGIYLVVCGECLAHVGTSNNLRARVGTLVRLGSHGGAIAVLSAAFSQESFHRSGGVS